MSNDNNEPIGPDLPPIGNLSIGGIGFRCHAACVYDPTDELLFVSAVGSESAVKAARALLCGGNGTAKIEIGGMNRWFSSRIKRAAEGYKVHMTKLAPHVVHMVAVAKAAGLMTAFSEEALWNELRSERYTTPVLRHWVPWIMTKLKETYGLGSVTQAGCSCGLLRLDDDGLDKLVSAGIKQGHLKLETK